MKRPAVIHKRRIEIDDDSEELSIYAIGPTRETVEEAKEDARRFALRVSERAEIARELETIAQSHIDRANEYAGGGSRSDNYPLHYNEEVRADAIRDAAEQIRAGTRAPDAPPSALPALRIQYVRDGLPPKGSFVRFWITPGYSPRATPVNGRLGYYVPEFGTGREWLSVEDGGWPTGEVYAYELDPQAPPLPEEIEP